MLNDQQAVIQNLSVVELLTDIQSESVSEQPDQGCGGSLKEQVSDADVNAQESHHIYL